MTRARPMSKAERAAMIDALRHMQRSGIGYRDLRGLASVPARAEAKNMISLRRPK